MRANVSTGPTPDRFASEKQKESAGHAKRMKRKGHAIEEVAIWRVKGAADSRMSACGSHSGKAGSIEREREREREKG